MRDARLGNGTPVDAIVIKRADGSPPGPYYCAACRAPVAGSGLRKRHKGHPHFAMPNGWRHRPGCDVLKRVRTQPSRTLSDDEPSGEPPGGPGSNEPGAVTLAPATAPTRLVLPPVAGRVETDGSPPAGKSRDRDGSLHPTTSKVGMIASRVEPVARAYLPGRTGGERPLEVAGVAGTTYAEIFAEYAGRTDQLGRPRLYYAPLLFAARYTPPPGDKEDVLRVGTAGAPRSVVVHHAGWTADERRDFRAAVAEARRARRQVHLTPDDREAWVCVLGAPDPSPDVLHVTRAAAVCCFFV